MVLEIGCNNRTYVLYSYMPYRNDTIIITDAMIKTHAGRLLYKYMYLSLYCKGSKRVIQGLRVRGSWRPNRTEIFWPPLLWPSALCLSRSPDAQLEALISTLLGAGFPYCILSASSLDPKLHRGSRGLSLPHLVYNSVRSPWNCNSNWTVLTE